MSDAPKVQSVSFNCPRCGYYVDRATALKESGKPGDLALCFACAAPLEFHEERPRWLTFAEAEKAILALSQGAREVLLPTMVGILTMRPSRVRARDLPPFFTCPRCGAVSYNPKDRREGYCGRCHDWTAPPR